MEIRLRFYNERYNMDRNYYTGDEDVYARVKLDDLDDLKRCWNALLHDYEGETYSAWYGRFASRHILCGGAFDPNDINDIEEAYRGYEG